LGDPFRVHNVYVHRSWLERYEGPLPEQLERLWEDVVAGRISVELRPREDVDRLLGSRRYRLQARALRWWSDLVLKWWIPLRRRVRRKGIVRLLRRGGRP